MQCLQFLAKLVDGNFGLPFYVCLQAIATSYGAASVTYSEEAEKKIELYTRAGFDSLPICMAKTQYRHAAKRPFS